MCQKDLYSQIQLLATGAAAVLVIALSGSSASADTPKCLQTISKSTAKYELAVQKALGKCQDANAKDPIGTPSCPDSGASGKISKALTKLQGKINGDCATETVDGLGFGGLVNRCNGGARDSLSCGTGADCPGRCSASGPEPMKQCTADVDCPAKCSGGTYTGMTCDGSGATLCTTGGGTCDSSVALCDNPAPGTCDAADGCPNLINGSAPFSDCTGPLATIADLTTCISCNSNSIATAATAFAYDGRRPPFGDSAYGLPDHMDKGKADLGCQRAIGKAVGKYFQTVRKATQKCTASLQKAKVMSCPDATLNGVISGAQSDLAAAISAACSGGTFAETVSEPDALKSLLNFEPLANPLTPLPNSAANFASVGESILGTMMTCSDTFAGGLATGLPACPTLGSNCGNGAIDPGEDCDDGNVLNGDTCPSNCKLPTACTVTGTVTVTFNVTSPVTLGGLSAYLSYDNTKVNIPGSGAGAAGSVTASAFSQSVNDLDSAIIVVLADPSGDIGSPPFSVQFNVCSGASVSASDFDCLVQNASGLDVMSNTQNVFGATCSVTVM
jgi:cysteine-rich repeat protein